MLKTKTKVKISVAGLMLAVSAFLPQFLAQNTSAEEASTTFQVNVKEFLAVTITNDHTTEGTGDPGEFLRNKIDVSVSTNNSNGFVAFMHSKNNTNLTNAISSSVIIPTLSSSTSRSAFGADSWGYNLTKTTSGSAAADADSESGNPNSTYSPMSTSNIALISGASGTTSGDQSIYFGAKSSMSKVSGTYIGTVVINVVTGTSTIPASDPVDPAVPGDDNNDAPGSVATYDSSNTRTVYSTTSTSGGVTTTTTQVSSGDNTALYPSDPLGEIYRTTESNISTGSSIASGLAIAASVAAASGAFFFILAKRREDDEEDEEDL